MHRARRAGLVLAGAALLVVGVVEPAVSASTSHVSKTPVLAGTAAATANVLGVSPGVSGLTLTTTIGESSAAYQHSETQAKSGTLDLGSLGLVLATSRLCGRADLPTSAQPQPLTADSESGASHLTHGAGGFGTEAVAVDPNPESATATTTTINQSLPGVLSMTGQSHAEVRYLSSGQQIATSGVTEDVSLLGGKVRFEGMHWTASRRSGVTTSRSTHFSLGLVTLAGVPLSAPDAAQDATISLINKVLAPVGLSFRKPSVTTNPQTGSVAIGPFTLRFSGSTLDREALGPAVNAVVTLEKIVGSLGSQGDNCANVRELIENLNDNATTLLNVVLGISEGAGALDIQLGGVAAAAQDPSDYSSPLGSGVISPVTPGGPAAVTPAGAQAGTPPASATSASGSQVVRAPVVQSAVVRCVSASPSRAHGCWRGIATVASAGALALGAALFVTDIALTRRRRVDPRSADASE